MIKKILVGIQPTGRLHIGNYLGVIKPGIDLQNDHDVTFMIAQFHAYTSESNFGVIENNCSKITEVLINLGAKNVVLQRPITLEVYWELLAREPIGPLTHMPQYKSKEQTVGMLTYPILMAADIIVSRCDAVLVGIDQEAHMEYYREIARKHGYNPAQSMISSSCSRVMSIKDPSKKMSKSLGDDHCIYIDDTLEEMESKIKKAPTDYEGLNNLYMIAGAFGYTFDHTKCAESKKELAHVIFNHFNQ